MDPAAYDRWWRTRINKEESSYVNHLTKELQKTSVGLDPLGNPQVMRTYGAGPRGANPTLTGSGAQVRTPKAGSLAGFPASHGHGMPQQPYQGASGGSRPASMASYRSGPNDDARSVTAQSNASYPRTPNFSTVSATDTEVLNRLKKLEDDLAEEKKRREVAERQIRELLVTPPQTGRR